MPPRVLLNAQQIETAVQLLTRDILAQEDLKHGAFALVGIRTHGVTLAQRLQTLLRKKTKFAIPMGILDITLYRDDLGSTRSAPVVQSTAIDFDIADRHIVLVDDVLYTGRTVRAALNALTDYGRPRFIKLAVLIDRGGRELPIEAQYVGATAKVDKEHMVKLYLQETDAREEAVVVAKAGKPAMEKKAR